MLNFGKLASNVLNSIDNAAKETLEEGAPKQPSATQIRLQRRTGTSEGGSSEALTTSGIETNVTEVNEETTSEIDRLNAECLELEDQVSSLKKEVQEAWDSYKAAQERAALREAELLDELKQIQKAKHTDKQSLLSQMGKVGEEVDEAVKQMRSMQAERDALQSQLRSMMDASAQRAAKEAALEGQLAEARAGSIQGAQGLREEMRSIVSASEQMRTEHASLLRQSQVRQAELEQTNVELTIGITEKQREITRLKLSLERAGKEDAESAVRQVDGVRQQMAVLTAQLEEERLRYQQQERRLRTAECEAKAAVLNWADEKQRLQCTITSLEASVTALEDKLGKDKQSTPKRKMYPSLGTIGGVVGGPGGEEDNNGIGGAGVLVMTEADEIRADLGAQVQNLTKQLLKKQGTLLDLQAERAALKSRNQDLQARCSKAEQQLALFRQDLEDDEGLGGGMDKDFDESGGGGFGANDLYGSSGSVSGITGLQQRRKGDGSLGDGYSGGAMGYYAKQNSHKVITNLEKVVVRRNTPRIDIDTTLTRSLTRLFYLNPTHCRWGCGPQKALLVQ